jgi:hypothetical protein
MISLQAEEMKMRQEEVATVKEERKEELRLLSLEREQSNDMLKKCLRRCIQKQIQLINSWLISAN